MDPVRAAYNGNHLQVACHEATEIKSKHASGGEDGTTGCTFTQYRTPDKKQKYRPRLGFSLLFGKRACSTFTFQGIPTTELHRFL